VQDAETHRCTDARDEANRFVRISVNRAEEFLTVFVIYKAIVNDLGNKLMYFGNDYRYKHETT
jgi:hypothetical protein